MTTLDNAKHPRIPVAARGIDERTDYIARRMVGQPRVKRKPKPVSLRRFSWQSGE